MLQINSNTWVNKQGQIIKKSVNEYTEDDITYYDRPEDSVLLFDENRGVYIPQNFVNETGNSIEEVAEKWHLNIDDLKILVNGPDDEMYWDAWDNVLRDAWTIHEGKKYTLHQDGDLWAVPEEE